MNDVFDRLLTSIPLNKIAGAVTSRSSDHYEPNVDMACHEHWEAPPPCKPKPPGMADLTGARFGRMAVVGFLGKATPKSEKARWLVRCACGDYEARTARAVRNPANIEDKCRKCRHWEVAQKRYSRLGARPIEAFTGEATHD